MALIKCPSCGEEISDKATVCPKCGVHFPTEKPKKVCKECGEILDIDATVCPKCGCPVGEKKEITISNKKISLTKILIAVVIIIIVIAGGFGIKSNNEKKAVQKAEQEAKEQKENYESTLQKAITTMLTGASDAEEAGNLIHDVWYDAIYKNYSEANTSKYVKATGDFNDSLSALFNDSTFKSKIASIESNKDSVSSLMKQLKNPPDEYEEAYDSLKELYNSYLDITNLVTDPTGSLQSFTSNFNDADSEVAQKMQAMQIYMN